MDANIRRTKMHLRGENLSDCTVWLIIFDSQEEAEQAMEILENLLKENKPVFEHRKEMEKRVNKENENSPA